MRSVGRVRSRIVTWSVAANVIVWCGLLAAATGLLVFIDSRFRFDLVGRWILLGLWVVVAAIATRRILIPSFVMPGIRSAMLRLERCYPQLSGRLVTAVELAGEESRARSGASGDLYRRVASAAEKMVGELDPRVAVPARPYVKRALLGFLILVGAFLGSWPMGGRMVIGLQRLFAPWSSVEWPFRTQIVLAREGPFSVRRGGTLDLGGQVFGEIPSVGTILVWAGEGDGAPYRARFSLEKDGRFEVRYQPVTADLRAQLAIGDAKSETLEVRMVPPPEVDSVELHLEYPAYSGLPPVVLPDGNVQALFGTTAELHVRASKPLQKAYLSWHDGTGQPVELNEPREGSVVFEVRQNAAYRLDLVDTMGFESDPSVTYRVEMIDNEYPRIESMVPMGDKEVTPQAELPIRLEVSDDFALAAVALSYRVGKSATMTVPLPLSPGVKRSKVEYVWKIEDLGVEPGAGIEYWVEVRDEGGHFARQLYPRTRRLHLRVVDAATLRRRLNERSEQLFSRLVELAQLQSESADAVEGAAAEVDTVPDVEGVVEGIRSEEWRQERIRRQTARIGELLSDLAGDFVISKVGRRRDVDRIREAGEVLRYLAAEPMPQVVLRLRHSLDLLEDVWRERR